MIKYKEIEVTKIEKQPISLVCDKCKKEYKFNDKENYNADFEIQEFHHIRFQGGFSSVFGDGNEVECDLCQDCLFNMIQDCYRDVTPVWEDDDEEESSNTTKEVSASTG